MFCLVTYILTQLISYEFILCCTCYDKLSIKKTILYLYIFYFVLIIGLLITPFDLSIKTEVTENTIIVQNVIEYSRIAISLIMTGIGILSVINTLKNKKS